MSWKPFFAVKINDKKLCARDLNNRIDTCQGDSGGPLVADKLSDDGKCKYLLSRPDQTCWTSLFTFSLQTVITCWESSHLATGALFLVSLEFTRGYLNMTTG